MLDEPALCLTISTVAIDHFDIVPANPGECEAPGEVLNGDAEHDGSWSFSAPDNGSTNGIVDGVGNNGSRGVQLHFEHRGDVVNALVPISIPLATTSAPALAFYHHTSLGSHVTAELGEMRMADIVGTGVPLVAHACLPAYMRGSVQTLEFGFVAGNGPLTTVLDYDTVIDDVQIVDDPSCAGPIADASFESPFLPVGAVFDDQDGAPTDVQIVQDASLAHSGVGALVIYASATCAGGGFTLRVITPAPTTTEGPAVALFYNTPPSSVTTTLFNATAPAVKDGSWHQAIICLDPQLAGLEQEVSVGNRSRPRPPTSTMWNLRPIPPARSCSSS